MSNFRRSYILKNTIMPRKHRSHHAIAMPEVQVIFKVNKVRQAQMRMKYKSQLQYLFLTHIHSLPLSAVQVQCTITIETDDNNCFGIACDYEKALCRGVKKGFNIGL